MNKNRKSELIKAIQESKTEISKTGAAYRDPKSIVYSSRAQEQLKTIAKIKNKITKK
jgi:hypothetical protein